MEMFADGAPDEAMTWSRARVANATVRAAGRVQRVNARRER